MAVARVMLRHSARSTSLSALCYPKCVWVIDISTVLSSIDVEEGQTLEILQTSTHFCDSLNSLFFSKL